MTTSIPPQCCGIVVSNSSSYLQATLDCLDANIPFVPLRDVNDEYRKRNAKVDHTIETGGGDPWVERAFVPQSSDALAMTAFTSGTTGQPKGVLLSHNSLKDAADRLESVMEIDASIREYVGTPCYHSFGFGRCRVVLGVGGKVFIPPRGFNPSEIASMLRDGSINAVSMVPTLVRVLLSNRALFGEEAARLKWIEIGSQPMGRSEKEDLRGLFPNAVIVQHYGLTEASRSTFLRIDQTTGPQLDSVGRPVGDTEVSIDVSSGKIKVRGSSVADTILVNGEPQTSVDENGWMLTSDLGELSDGFLYFKGRADDVINCGGLKLQPHEIEARMSDALGIRADSFGVARIPDPIRGETVLVATTPNLKVDRERVREVALKAIQSLGVQLSDSISVLEIEELPVNAVGKIQRSRLTQWYEERAPQVPQVASGDRDSPRDFRSILQEVAGNGELLDDSTFVNLGGDSLSYVSASIAIEQIIGHIPDNWENQTVSELEAHKVRSGPFRQLETSILVRALGILFIISGHFEDQINTSIFFNPIGITYPGGCAVILLMAAGFSFARFGLPRAIKSGPAPILLSLWRVLLPTAAFLLTVQLVSGRFSWPTILMYSNFIDPYMNSGLGPWFIQNLLQILALLAVAFSFSSVRALVGRSPYRFCLGALAISMVSFSVGPYIWDTAHLDHRVPHMFMYAFMVGCCIYLASESRQKILLSAVLVLLLGLGAPEYTWLTVVGGLTLIWSQNVRLLWPLNILVGAVGGASLFIYLSHGNFQRYTISLLQTDSIFFNLLFALVGGVVLWQLWTKAIAITDSLRKRLLRSRN